MDTNKKRLIATIVILCLAEIVSRYVYYMGGLLQLVYAVGGVLLFIYAKRIWTEKQKQLLLALQNPIELQQAEEMLFTSENKSITLTTNRIIQRGALQSELHLKDITSYEIIKSLRSILKIVIAILLGLILLACFAMYNQNIHGAHREAIEMVQAAFIALVIATIGTIIVLFVYPEKKLKINSSYGMVEFSVSGLSDSSLNNFINTMNSQRQKLRD